VKRGGKKFSPFFFCSLKIIHIFAPELIKSNKMLTQKQKNLIDDLIVEFETINSKHGLTTTKSNSLFDKSFDEHLKLSEEIHQWYADVASNNAKIIAKGEELKDRLVEKLKAIFANYNIEIEKNGNHVSLYIVIKEDENEKKFNPHVWFSLSVFIKQHKAFCRGGETSIDKGTTIYSHCAITYESKQVDLDNFERTIILQQVFNELLNNHGEKIKRK